LIADPIDGLAYLRGLGVAGLDIKPGNIVYIDDVRLHVVDFGTVVRVGSEDEIVEGVYVGKRRNVILMTNYAMCMVSHVTFLLYTCSRVECFWPGYFF